MKRYTRAPEHDRRIGCSDDFAGDAWLDTATGNIRHVAVGRDPNRSEAPEVTDSGEIEPYRYTKPEGSSWMDRDQAGLARAGPVIEINTSIFC